MRTNKILFFTLVAIAFTACDAGKFYARKKIDRHYEEVTENKTAVLPAEAQTEVFTSADQNIDPPAFQFNEETNGIRPVVLEQNKKQNKPLANTINKVNHASFTVVPSVINPVKHKHSSYVSKKEGRGGVMFIIVGLLFLLLALVFIANFGIFGLIMGWMFAVVGAILLLIGIIRLF